MATLRSARLPAVLFDLDGTLIDTIDLLLRSVRHAFEGWPGRKPTDEAWIRGIGTPLVSQLGEYTNTEAELTHLLERYRAYQHEHHDRLTRCYDHVPDVVRQLSERGYPLAVVTSKASAIARRSLGFVGLEPYFDTVVGFDDTTRHKPDPDPVIVAIDRLGTTAARAAFVGDSPHDILAGRAAGVMTVAALWGPFDRETLLAAGPDHLIGCLPELPAILDQAFGP